MEGTKKMYRVEKITRTIGEQGMKALYAGIALEQLDTTPDDWRDFATHEEAMDCLNRRENHYYADGTIEHFCREVELDENEDEVGDTVDYEMADDADEIAEAARHKANDESLCQLEVQSADGGGWQTMPGAEFPEWAATEEEYLTMFDRTFWEECLPLPSIDPQWRYRVVEVYDGEAIGPRDDFSPYLTGEEIAEIVGLKEGE